MEGKKIKGKSGIATGIAFVLIMAGAAGLAKKINAAQPQGNDRPEGMLLADELPAFLKVQDAWVDSVFNALTPDERTAQLFMVAAYSKNGTAPNEKITSLIRDYKIGGLIFMQGGPGRQAILNNYYQSISKTPLMIGIDGEWGLSMRLDSTMKFPWQMTLGAVQDDQLIYEMGKEIALQCRRMGIHVNFAPSVDVNNNKNNPVIGARSFGENKINVSNKGIAYMKGMQDNFVLASAKHFPGHGDTDKDSHTSLPVIGGSRARLDSLEMYPFTELIKKGVGSIMIAHLSVPALDNTPNMPTTLSRKVVTTLLQEEMGFKGLIFTDALNMKGVADFYEPGVVDVKALLAGNDILLFSGDVPKAIEQINASVKKGEMTRSYIDEKCKKILKAKYWMGLHRRKPVALENLYQDLHTKQSELILRRLTEASLTLVKNQDDLIPLKKLDTLRIASISIGNSSKTKFQSRLSDYATVTHFFASEEPSATDASAMLTKLRDYNLVVISVHKSNESPFKSYRIPASARTFIKTIAQQKKVVLAVFANAYSLSGFEEAWTSNSVIMSYQDSEFAQDYTAQLIFGGIPAKGKLPVSISEKYKAGHGILTEGGLRMKYSIPEDVGIKSGKLLGIDAIALKAIYDTVFPGCQILAAKDGVIFYQQSFGYHTYEKKTPVTNTDLYDIASVTKISSTIPGIMKLVDEGKIDIRKTLGDYLPELKGTDKAGIILADLLAHQAGFKAWIPFHFYTVNKDLSFKQGAFETTASKQYPLPVAENIFANALIPDTIFKGNVGTPLSGKRKYLYSDLGYYFLQRIIEKYAGTPLDAYASVNFYKPLGASTLGYLPLQRFAKEEIAPTENDLFFRKQLLQGYVHDQGAALLGGVGGHAGLFSNANDLAKLMQMYMNMGEYGGERYISAATMKEFTRCQFCNTGNRRGLGFDKPVIGGEGTHCKSVSASSFGHAGFTGTFVWADPDKRLVYIFLSNRVHPDAENRKLIKEGQRAMIQQVIYNAI